METLLSSRRVDWNNPWKLSSLTRCNIFGIKPQPVSIVRCWIVNERIPSGETFLSRHGILRSPLTALGYHWRLNPSATISQPARVLKAALKTSSFIYVCGSVRNHIYTWARLSFHAHRHPIFTRFPVPLLSLGPWISRVTFAIVDVSLSRVENLEMA